MTTNVWSPDPSRRKQRWSRGLPGSSWTWLCEIAPGRPCPTGDINKHINIYTTSIWCQFITRIETQHKSTWMFDQHTAFYVIVIVPSFKEKCDATIVAKSALLATKWQMTETNLKKMCDLKHQHLRSVVWWSFHPVLSSWFWSPLRLCWCSSLYMCRPEEADTPIHTHTIADKTLRNHYRFLKDNVYSNKHRPNKMWK